LYKGFEENKEGCIKLVSKPAYFLIAVSTKENLDLCIRHAMAGFTSSVNGVWSYEDINVGDFVSFLYGAKIFNLYRVKDKFAIKDAEQAPPWPILHFRSSGKKYSFPFRLILEPVRRLTESLVRVEFAYVAENLLLRGGYRKTHFQADQTTLQNVSQMGSLYKGPVEHLNLSNFVHFTPKYTLDKQLMQIPEVFLLNEKILQAAIRSYLSNAENCKRFLEQLSLQNFVGSMEILAEKAFPEGHVDLLMKENVPIGESKQIIIEIKKGELKEKDVLQLKKYMDEIGEECLTGVLIGRDASKVLIKKVKEHHKKISIFVYTLEKLLTKETFTFEELVQSLLLQKIV